MSSFQIHIKSSGKIITVPTEKTIYQVLKENNFDIPVSCNKGICGTCMTRYTSGDIDHHDKILSDEEREEYLTVCCSRARSGKIILDL